jgi:rfaE bifunctional protein kinase chain/domain
VNSLIQSFIGAKLLVIGDAMLDEYSWGDSTRISPEAPVAVVDWNFTTFVAGGAANAARSAAALGADTILVGVVGSDAAADQLRSSTGTVTGLTTYFVSDPSRHTTRKLRIMANEHQVARVDTETRSPLSGTTEHQLIRTALSCMSDVDAVLLSDYGKGTATRAVIDSVISSACQHDVPVIVDPKGSDFTKYRGATIIKPNMVEAAQAVGATLPTAPDQLADVLASILPGTTVVITLGRDGIVWRSPHGDTHECPALPVTVFDVTGAGDSVAACLALGAGCLAPMATSVSLAVLAAGLAVEKVGTSTVTTAELRGRLDSGVVLPVQRPLETLKGLAI